jgi:hypothetical protein
MIKSSPPSAGEGIFLYGYTLNAFQGFRQGERGYFRSANLLVPSQAGSGSLCCKELTLTLSYKERGKNVALGLVPDVFFIIECIDRTNARIRYTHLASRWVKFTPILRATWGYRL